MEIEFLGSLTLVLGGERFSVPGEKARATLAVLALNVGTVVASDELVDELWANSPVRNAKNALQANITRLRKLVNTRIGHQDGNQFIQTVADGYLLDLPQEAIDALRFVCLAGQGAEFVDERPGEAIELLRRALKLWRGPALHGTGDGVRCRAAASWFDENRLVAQENLIAAQLALGGERTVVPELERLVARYPLRERLCEELMLALYRCGRQAEALEAYHRTRHRLITELGVEPGLSLQQRFRAVLAQDPALVTSARV